MMKYKILNARFELFLLFSLFLSTGTIYSQSSENYRIKNSVVDQSGAASQSTDQKVVDAVGQPSPVGEMNSANYEVLSGYFNKGAITTSVVSGPVETAIPQEFELFQNYPNPFNPETTIRFGVKHPCRVVLIVFDLLGREMIHLVNETYQAGQYQVTFDAANLPSGVYVYRIQMENYSAMKKMVLLK